MNQHSKQNLTTPAFRETNLPIPGKALGKVRDWYPLPDGKRLIITTDRLSAFDRVLSAVPYKGQVLNQLSSWWFQKFENIIPNHKVDIPDENALIALEAKPIKVEVIVRGYITGVTSTALWYRYSLGEREIYGYKFQDGLIKNQILPEPIITPTTKGGITGHDERLTCSEVVQLGLLKADDWDFIQTSALALFQYGAELALRGGLILVDTKYEFGFSADGNIILIDEVHTPDSSRFWKADSYQTRIRNGEEPENFDKEFIRIAYSNKGYRGEGEPPDLGENFWKGATDRYITIYELLTGQPFIFGEYPIEPRLLANLRKAGILE